MTELVTALRRFVLRDMMLLVGGAWVIASVFRVLNCEIPASIEWWKLILIAGASYSVGYAVQDGTGLLQITHTSYLKKAYWPFSWIYFLFTHRKWKDVDAKEDLLKRDLVFRSHATESDHDDYGRILNFKQLGSTMGSCSLVSSIVLLGWGRKGLSQTESTLAWFAFWIGLLLILLGWVKLAQQSEFLMNHPKADAKAK